RETQLPARGAYRLPARGDRRGTRPGRRAGRDRPAVLARSPRLRDRPPVDRARPALFGPCRQGHRRLDLDPVPDQHRRQHRRAADQGPDPAADELRRLEHPRGVPRDRDPVAHRLREPADDARGYRMSTARPPEGARTAARQGEGTPMLRTLMIMAGGTGGHIMPGLAVADEMRARSWQVVWLGVPGGLEADLVPSHGIPMRWVRIGGLRGKGI